MVSCGITDGLQQPISSFRPAGGILYSCEVNFLLLSKKIRSLIKYKRVGGKWSEFHAAVEMHLERVFLSFSGELHFAFRKFNFLQQVPAWNPSKKQLIPFWVAMILRKVSPAYLCKTQRLDVRPSGVWVELQITCFVFPDGRLLQDISNLIFFVSLAGGKS